MVEFKTPSEQNMHDIKEFADVMSTAIELAGKTSVRPYAAKIVEKIHEAIMWHSHAVLNAAESSSTTEEVVEEEQGFFSELADNIQDGVKSVVNSDTATVAKEALSVIEKLTSLIK